MNTEEFDIQAIQVALQKLLSISTPQEGLKILLEHPELLTDEADMVFGMLIDQAREQKRNSFVGVLTGLRELAQEVRQAQTVKN